jgi:hypothetical protein
VIASLLPGLRDLRTPLTTGYLWLIALWLLLHDRLPKSIDDATGPIRSLYELGGFLGSTAVLAAVSFVAYLLGSMLLFNVHPEFTKELDPLFRAPTSFVGRLRRALRTGFATAILNSNRSMFRQLETFLATRLRETAQDFTGQDHFEVLRRWGSAYEEAWRKDKLSLVIRLYIEGIVGDLPAIAIQLQPKNRDFWDTYDRQLAEAQFRFGIAPPLALIIGILTWQTRNLWWLLLLIVPLYLLILGVRHWALATSTLVQAVVLKIVEPPVLERLREQVAKKRDQEQRETEKRQRQEEQARKETERDEELRRSGY